MDRIYWRCFRLVAPHELFATFSSDRSHMIRGGKYLQPPPEWPAIQLEGIANNLFPEFVEMQNTRIGRVLDEADFLAFAKSEV